MEVLVLLGDGIKGGWILWGPLQGPTFPHDLQRGSRHGPLDICIRDDSNEGVVKPVTEGFVQDIQWLTAYFYDEYLVLA